MSLGKGKNILGLLGEEGRKCWEMVRDGEKRMGKGERGEGEKEKGGGGGGGVLHLARVGTNVDSRG